MDIRSLNDEEQKIFDTIIQNGYLDEILPHLLLEDMCRNEEKAINHPSKADTIEYLVKTKQSARAERLVHLALASATRALANATKDLEFFHSLMDTK